MPAERIIELYLASDIFVLASRFEGYGMALAEAIGHGLPVILHERDRELDERDPRLVGQLGELLDGVEFALVGGL